MTIQGAISQLVALNENSMMPNFFNPYFEKIIETVSEYVETSENPRWIPFSERMPEDGQAILLSGNITVECVVWDDDLKEWYRDFGDVGTAWMPLPEPYRPEVGK